MKTYKIYTLGCKVNQYDSGKLAAELERAGLAKVSNKADLAIINSCAVTQIAINKSARMIKLAKKENPGAKIRLIGCWARLKEGKVKRKTDEIVSPPFAGLATTNRARYFIKIQDGCEQFCSYCIIPYARGGLKSRGEREVINEIKQAVKAGYREIVLSGIHLGLYGRAESNLVGLLKKLIAIPNLGRLRLSSIEITEVMDELVKLIAVSGKICRHLHIPLQSGSDKILKFMNRPYDLAYFKNKILKIKNKIPNIAISTDIMVGFPGETEKDFQETKNFIKQMKFSRLHVFPFSAHAELPAAKLPGQVKENERLRRAKVLRKIGVKLANDYKKKFKGKILAIVVEQIKPDKIMGKTEYYFDLEAAKASLKNKNLRTGEIVKVKN